MNRATNMKSRRETEGPRTLSWLMDWGVRVVGLWPDTFYASVIRVSWTIVMMVAHVFLYRYVIVHRHSKDLIDLTDSLSTNLCYTLVFLKLIGVWWKRRVFTSIYFQMANNWKECDLNERDTSLMINTYELSHRYSKGIVAAYVITFCFYTCNFIIPGAEADSRQLPIKMDFPFDYEVTPRYQLIVLAQYFHQFSSVIAEGMLNAMVVTLVLHADGQINIICKGLTEISSSAESNRRHSLYDLIGRHQRLIFFTDSVASLFSYVALLQIVLYLGITCLVGFSIVVSFNGNDSVMALVKFVPFYGAMNLGAFMLCFLGEYLISKSQSIGDTAYESLWYDMKPGTSRLLLLVILRSQRRLTITVGKFTDLSLEFFANILKISTSYVSVLYAMY